MSKEARRGVPTNHEAILNWPAKQQLKFLVECLDQFSVEESQREKFLAVGKKVLDRLDELEETDKANTELIGVFNVREIKLEQDNTKLNERIAELIPRQTDLEEENSQLKQDLTKSRQQVERLVEQVSGLCCPPDSPYDNNSENPCPKLSECEEKHHTDCWQSWLDAAETSGPNNKGQEDKT